ncbi:hypothetical protein Pfo_023504 [Paulownia fortunei]|nr:hypothetical protein Pfo_023504 [Paulownia fortunei]
MEAKNTLAPITMSSSQRIPPGSASKPSSKIHPSGTAGRTPFSAVAPPQYLHVSRLQLHLTLDTIDEETTDDYNCTESSDVVNGISEDYKLVEETSEFVFEMAKSSYKTCFREMQENNFPSFSYNFRCV